MLVEASAALVVPLVACAASADYRVPGMALYSCRSRSSYPIVFDTCS